MVRLYRAYILRYELSRGIPNQCSQTPGPDQACIRSPGGQISRIAPDDPQKVKTRLGHLTPGWRSFRSVDPVW